MLEKMVRIEYAIELMNDDVEGNLMTMRKEFDAMRGEFEVMKQHMNEAEEDNRKTMKEEFDALRGEFDFMKQHMNEAEEDNRKTMKKEFNAVKGEFEVMKQHMNEAEENNRKAIKEGFDAVRGEFEVMKLTMKEALEYLEYLKQKKDGKILILTLSIQETLKRVLLQTLKTHMKYSTMLLFIQVYTVCKVKKRSSDKIILF